MYIYIYINNHEFHLHRPAIWGHPRKPWLSQARRQRLEQQKMGIMAPKMGIQKWDKIQLDQDITSITSTLYIYIYYVNIYILYTIAILWFTIPTTASLSVFQDHRVRVSSCCSSRVARVGSSCSPWFFDGPNRNRWWLPFLKAWFTYPIKVD